MCVTNRSGVKGNFPIFKTCKFFNDEGATIRHESIHQSRVTFHTKPQTRSCDVHLCGKTGEIFDVHHWSYRCWHIPDGVLGHGWSIWGSTRMMKTACWPVVLRVLRKQLWYVCWKTTEGYGSVWKREYHRKPINGTWNRTKLCVYHGICV